jgi:protein TonB
MLVPILLAILAAHGSFTPTTSVPQHPPSLTAQDEPEQAWPPAGVFRAGSDVTLPKLIKETRPDYTADSMRAKVQGAVVMEVVVLTDGTVGEVRVIRSLDKKHGLDDECVKTVKEWQFTPGKKDGIAVPVIVDVTMTFVLT